MSRYHVNHKSGKPGLCRAKHNCPFGGPSEHYATREAAQVVAESAGMKSALQSTPSRRTSIKTSPLKSSENPNTFTVNGREFKANEAKILAATHNTTQKFLTMRAEFNDLTENPKRMSAAYKRFNKVNDFALVRGNEELMKKLQHSVLADSSFFKDKNGDRVHVDEALNSAADYKVWEDNRKNFEKEFTTLAQDKEVAPGSYKFDGVTVKVTDGEIDSKYAESLDPQVRESISSYKPSLNIDKVKATMPDHIKSQVIRFENVAEVVDGRAADRETIERITPKKEGGSAMDRFKENGAAYGKFVRQAQETTGGKTAIKNARDEITKQAKDEASNLNERYMQEHAEKGNSYGYNSSDKTKTGAKNVLFGGRQHDSGILVTARDRINPAAVKEVMTQEQIDACTDKKLTIDKEKASSVLPKEQYDKLFSARKVSMAEARVSKKK